MTSTYPADMVSAGNFPAGYDKRELADIDSTNTEALRCAAAGALRPLWIRADRQSAGHGRRGNYWHSDTGNLFTSLLLPCEPRAEAAQLSFAAALAVSDMAAEYAPGTDIRVKWPNDVLASGKKIAGILLERAGDALVIGIGVNLASFPERTRYGATSLKALGGPVPDAAEALCCLAIHFARWHERWNREGFSALRTPWLARACGLGQEIEVRLAGSEFSGIFTGVDETGALLLGQGASVRSVTAGEVFFPQKG